MEIIKRILQRLKWEIGGFINYIYFSRYKKKVSFDVLSDEETIKLIIEKRMSMARFGDGEYRVMNNLGNGFQNPNEALRDRLKEVLCSNNPNCLVCIPRAFVNHEGLKRGAKITWYDFIKTNGKFVLSITPHKTFGEASCTRFYIDYLDKNYATKVVPLLKKIWYGRDLLIVEGINTKLGCGNDLFEGASSVRRIECPSTNAFSKHDDILKAVQRNAQQDTLILLALGMTATVLAYDLSNKGYQALDIGHIDVEYEWYKMGARTKVLIPGKSVNELGQNAPNPHMTDSRYEHEIVEKLVE